MRVTSSIWVSALIRRATSAGAFATVVHKGAEEAGAVFVLVNDLNGHFSLYCPAPQMHYDETGPGERIFECLIEQAQSDQIAEKVAKERAFDPDIWLVEIEDRKLRSFINPDHILTQ